MGGCFIRFGPDSGGFAVSGKSGYRVAGFSAAHLRRHKCDNRGHIGDSRMGDKKRKAKIARISNENGHIVFNMFPYHVHGTSYYLRFH